MRVDGRSQGKSEKKKKRKKAKKKKTRGSKTNRDISQVDVCYSVIKYSGRKMVRVIIPQWVSSGTFDAQDLL